MSRMNEFPPSPSWTAVHTPLSSGHGQVGWGRRAAIQDNAGHRPFLERVPTRSSTPMEPYPSTQIIFFNNMNHGFDSRLPPILNRSTPEPFAQGTTSAAADTDDSELTKEEQGVVLQKLRKHTYSPVSKVQPRKLSLYYRELNRDIDANANANATEKHKDADEKNCAVCLEDFEPSEEVMLTPCHHMFHEECIVPWVKNHGKCPVCRSALCETTRKISSALNSDRSYVRPARHGLLAGEVISLFQVIDAAFIRGA